MIIAKQINHDAEHILYDANQQPDIDSNWFDPDYWQRQNCIAGSAQGRASVFFINWQDKEYVLRHYHRGGFVAKIVRDGYLWTGLSKTRAWREWHLLAQLNSLGLPAPIPVAAHVTRKGLYYCADLITEKIIDTASLADCLSANSLPDELWQSLGSVIAHFHNAGVDHADLNAHNVILRDGSIFLIDFDRGRIRACKPRWQRSNIRRLLRSLMKLKGLRKKFCFELKNWHALEQGYVSQINH